MSNYSAKDVVMGSGMELVNQAEISCLLIQNEPCVSLVQPQMKEQNKLAALS